MTARDERLLLTRTEFECAGIEIAWRRWWTRHIDKREGHKELRIQRWYKTDVQYLLTVAAEIYDFSNRSRCFASTWCCMNIRFIQIPVRAASSFTRIMPSVAEFVGAALVSDPSLSGSNDKDRAAIESLQSETEAMSKDLPVRPSLNLCRSLLSYSWPVQTLDEQLTPLTYLHSNTPSTADISLYCHVHPSMVSLPS